MKINELKKICVIGAGTMGAGIAQTCAQAGFAVSMMDVKEEFVKKALEKIKTTFEEGIKRGKITEQKMQKILENICITTDLEMAIKNSNLIIEAIFEDMAAKKELFKKLDVVCDKSTIFATNTSTLSVTEMAKVTDREDKIIGLHFFYPAAINRLIEVIPGERTSTDTLETILKLCWKLGKIPIKAKDAPGFAVNRFFVPFLNESCKILEEKISNIPTIDYAAKEVFGIRMGPFELMNATGISIAYHSEEALHKALGEFYKPAQALKMQLEQSQKWNLEGDINKAQVEIIKNRFLGLIFNIVCHLVDEGVATKEEVDRGATTGLRWNAGPFAMMNSIGIQRAYELAAAFAEKRGIKLPESLERQAKLNLSWDLRNVKVEKKDGIAIIAISRPEALNALNTNVLSDLKTTLAEIQKDRSMNIVIITGEGTAFVAGADIAEMIEKTPLNAREFTQLGQETLKKIENLDKVVIAAVNGFALGGGCELALACDIIIASEDAKFGLPEVGLGIHPGLGGTQRLPRLVGRNKAKELLFTGDTIDAKEAEKIGLANKVVPAEKLMEETMSLAKKIASKAPVAIKLAKSAVNKGLEVDLEHGLAYEVETACLTFSTKDSIEGMKAFLEKRKPEFKGE